MWARATIFAYGDDLSWNGLEYSGPNQVNTGNMGTIVGGAFKNCVRLGGSTAASAFFLVHNAGTTNILFDGIDDRIISSLAPIRIIAGGTFVIRDIVTKTTASEPIDAVGATNAIISDVAVQCATAPPIASAATITLLHFGSVFFVSGTTTITSVTTWGWEGKSITIVFTGALTFTKGGNLKLNSNFVTAANSSNHAHLC